MLFAVACGAVSKPPDPNRRLDVKMSGSLFEAPNGYKFAALPEPGSSVVRIDVRYPVGSADDPPGKEGLAHLVEHLLFEGVFTRDGKETTVGAELGRLALASNAATYRDHTSYETLTTRADLENVLELEVARMLVGCRGLTEEILAREREVVINELRQNAGVSGPDTARKLDEQAYPDGHPYRRVDTIESVSKLQLADVCAFIAGPYHKGKAFVIASGDVDGPALQAAVAPYFGALEPRDLAPRAPLSVAPPNPGSVTISADVDAPTLVVLFPLPPQASTEYRLLEMSMTAVADRLGSFALTYGWGATADATIMGGVHAPVLAVSIEVKGNAITSEMRDAVERATEHAARTVYRPGDDQHSPNWKHIWNNRAESLLARWDSLGGRNALLGDFLQFDRDEKFLIGRIAELTQATPAEAHGVAEKYLTTRRARFVLLTPSGQPGSTSSLTYSGGAGSHPTRVDGRLADTALVMPKSSGAIVAERYQLKNGLSVVLWPDANSPITSARLVVDSGRAHEPKGREGVAFLVGATDVRLDHLVFDDRELSTGIDQLIYRIGIELRNPGYELTDEVKGVMAARMKTARYRDRAKYELALARALYGASHPYARPAMTDSSLAGLGHDAITGWGRDHLVGNNATLVLAGKFDAELVKKHIAFHLDFVEDGDDSAELTTEPATSPGPISGVASSPQLTVELHAAFVRGAGYDALHHFRVVLAQVLNAQLATLRGTNALTYGFAASYEARAAGGLWMIGGEADASRAREASVALATVLADMRRDPEAYRAAFVLGRKAALEGLLVGATSAAGVADRLALQARFDLGDHYFRELATKIAGLTLADFHKFVVRELDPATMVLGVYGNAGPVGAAIER